MRPTSVEPVNEIPAIFLFLHNASPTDGTFFRLQVTTLKTPFGNPASSANFANARAVSGVSSAGFITTVHPFVKQKVKEIFMKKHVKNHPREF